MTYSIDFKLVVPRYMILRLDLLPFLVIYSILGYLLYQNWDDPNLNLYFRLAIIGSAFLHSLTYIMGHWSKKMQSFIQYKTIGGSIKSNLQNASHVYIIQKRQGQKTVHSITDLYKQELQSEETLYIFIFQQRKFYFCNESENFKRLKPKIEGQLVKSIVSSAFVESTQKEFYDNNILQIPIRPFANIFRDQLIDPFAFFQLFSVFLWMMDQNKTLSFFILVMLLGSAFMISVQRIKALVGYRSMTLAPHQVQVLEKDQWIVKSSYDLLPGDIVAVQPGYNHKKSDFDMMSDSEYLAKAIPFFSKLGKKPTNPAQQPQKQEQKLSYKNVSCDILLLGGSCVVNEAILTGEAIPQIKQSMTTSDSEKKFHQTYQKGNMLFCGTEILQINEQYNQQELASLLKECGVANKIPKPSVKCCIGFVLKTGFDTSKGKLVRRVVAHAQNPKIEQKDGLWIILFLLICSIFTAIYVLNQGLDNQERSKEKLFLRCILILTTVVPPQLPMILNLAVNNSILYLQKKKIFVSEPKKIPLGGRVNVVAFDKTGTLTEDKFIFEGIVDDCNDYKQLKDFKNCSNENNVVLAGCHSLISVDRSLTGDPIELMFFDLTKWEYTSKHKQAKKVLQRVIIQKVYPFKAELKRMSCAVEHVPQNGGRKMKALVKGAPQAIQKLLKQIPQNYRQAYTYYTKQGYRLLALASKQIDYAHFKTINNKDKQRDYCEQDLQFCGFFICSSPLKEDTVKHIHHLQRAKYNILIITGDNILTAAKVALNLDMGQSVIMLQKQNSKNMLLFQDGTSHQITGLKDLQHQVKLHPKAIIATSSAKDLPHDYFREISVFARASPHDKEVIVKYFRDSQGGIVYAGDGTNDVGGLRNADVGVAVVGTTNISEVVKKEQQKKEEQTQFNKKLKDIRNDMGIAITKKMQLITQMTQQRMRKNASQGGGMLADDQIKFGDACIAAPFTSKHSNSIKCVLIIIRQAIATLVTTVQTYKILAISSMIQAYSLAQMNLTNLKYSQTQSLVLGVLASINFYFFSNAKPLRKISDVRAPHTIWNPWFAISFFGQIIIFLGINYYALNYIGLEYVLEQDKNISADKQFQKSFINTVIMLFSAISQSVVFIVNHGGEPHMESLIKNSKYFKFLVIPLIVCFVLTANLLPEVSEYIDLKFEGIPFEANLKMLYAFAFLTFSTYFLDRFCRFAQYKKMIGWF